MASIKANQGFTQGFFEGEF